MGGLSEAFLPNWKVLGGTHPHCDSITGTDTWVQQL